MSTCPQWPEKDWNHITLFPVDLMTAITFSFTTRNPKIDYSHLKSFRLFFYLCGNITTNNYHEDPDQLSPSDRPRNFRWIFLA